jgi:3-dehydroquinate synthase
MSETSRVQVHLGPRSYPVVIGSSLLGGTGPLVREAGLKHGDAFVVTSADIARHHYEPLRESLAGAGFNRIVRHDVPAGEQGKNWEEFSRACGALLEAFPDTGSVPLVFLLGGGVVGDLGGFAAAVFRRGVPFIQLPTTLLAAVDSSVGGKVAVNFGGVKNIMGAFCQPRMVVCDLGTLRTLSPRELRSGTAEIIKYGAVCSGALFEQLERGALEKLLVLDGAVLADVVAQCVRLKAEVVEKDEFDKLGIRNVLNFGHTVGHALELSADYALTHGEAIGIGMVAATRIAVKLGLAGEDFLSRLQALIQRAGLPTSFADRRGLLECIVRAMQMDKKFKEGRNLFVLPKGIGSWQPKEDIDWPLVVDCVRSVLR